MNDLSIIRAECERFYSISHERFMSTLRDGDLVKCRQQAMFLSLKHTKHNLKTIGFWMGRKDHATVLHAKKTVNNLMETDKNYLDEFRQLEDRVLLMLINKLSVTVKVNISLRGDTYIRDGKEVKSELKEVSFNFDCEGEALKFYRDNILMINSCQIQIESKPPIEFDGFVPVNEMVECKLK